MHHIEGDVPRQLDTAGAYLHRSPTGDPAFMLHVNSSFLHPDPEQAGSAATNAGYRLHVMAGGDDVSQIMMFEARFADCADGSQTVTVRRWEGNDTDTTGLVVAEGTTGLPIQGQDGLTVWAGLRADPFVLNFPFLQELRDAIDERRPVRDWPDGTAVNAFDGETVFAIVLELPVAAVQKAAGGPNIGYCTTVVSEGHQVQYCGPPMVGNLIPDTKNKGLFNATPPGKHRERWWQEVRDRALPLVDGVVDKPEAYADAVADRCTDVIRCDLTAPLRFDEGGHNGQSVAADISEAFFGLISGRKVRTGLATPAPPTEMPYLFPPDGNGAPRP